MVKKSANATTKRRPGRPSSYTEKIGKEICKRIAMGESLREIAKKPGMPGLSTIVAWIVDDKHSEFQTRYAQARKAQAELLADDLIGISDDGRNDWIEQNGSDEDKAAYQFNGEAVQRSRLRADTRKWVAARLLSRYMDKQHHEHTGKDGEPLQVLLQQVSGTAHRPVDQDD